MEGINVLSFGTYVAGPLTCKFLQQMGARITTIKPPRTHPKYKQEREWNAEVCDELLRDQHIIHVDLTKESVVPLIAKADILVENFRPGVMEKFGLSYEICKQINPKIIYVSLPGFASGDIRYEHVKAYEGCILAASGIFKDMGLNRQLRGIHTSFSELPLASVYGAIFATYAILCKLIHIHRSDGNVDSKIEVPLASALSEALVHNSIDVPCPYSYLSSRKRLLLNKEPKLLTYAELDETMDCFYSHYVCKDMRPLYMVAPCHKSHQVRLLKALNLSNMLPYISAADPYDVNTHKKYGLGGNQTGGCSEALKKKIAEVLRKETAQYWEDFLGPLGIPCCAHKSFCEWLSSKHSRQSRLVSVRDDNSIELGPLTWKESTTSAEWNLFRNPDNCLSGIQVLDCSNVIAGPTIGTMLARMGAEVIKVDNTTPSYSPVVTIVYGFCANQGKQSVLLDYATDEGRQQLNSMISKSHVIILNTTYERMRVATLDIESIRAINPSILLVHFDAWGGPEQTYMNDYLGYDDNVQAAQGIMERFGGGIRSVEEHAHIGTIDVIAGVSGAVACSSVILDVLVHKRMSVGRCSLSSVGQYLQFPFACGTLCNIIERARSSKDRLGIANRGKHPLYRCYDASDRSFIFVAALSYSDDRLKSVIKTLYPEGCIPTHLGFEFLLEFFKTRPLTDWIQKFGHIFAFVGVNSIENLRQENMSHTTNSTMMPTFQFMTRVYEHGTYTMTDLVAIRMQGVQIHLSNAPKYGSHSKELIGVANQWSTSYLPYHDECPVCLEVIQKPMRLKCDHTICVKCATRCSLEQIHHCPICRSEQEMSEVNLLAKSKLYKSQYMDWRRGKSKGATDMENIRRVKSSQCVTGSFEV